MGWKLFKSRFAIEHIVQMTEGGLTIGSRWVPELVTIDAQTGAIRPSEVSPSFLRDHYPHMLEASADEFVQLIAARDTFAASVTVFTFEGAEIIETLCEEPGFPNVTHGGNLMHNNRYSTDRNTVIAWAKREAGAAVEYGRKAVERAEKELADIRAQLAGHEAEKAKLEAEYPTPAHQ